ncbi:MAG: ATP-dependent metallopeptidase FtsH/Yme1/Tma family protein [Actinomycetota bacterium]
MNLFELIFRPEFLIAATLIIGGTVAAMVLTKRQGKTSTRFQPGRAKNTADMPSLSFADVAGLDEAIADLREIRDHLANPGRYEDLGARLPSGILLYGPPGCGKTLLARALAGEGGVPFYFVSASSFVAKFVGLGAARVRQLFAEAKENTPSIVFIDELDAIGRRRSDNTSGEREFDNTLNELLVELDGFMGSSGVLILGATNRPELIDPALLRPGRFDRRILIDRPDVTRRQQILELHARGRPMSRDVDWGLVARDTPGLTAAELANIVNEAALLAARTDMNVVSVMNVRQAVDRILSGTRSSRVMDEAEKQLIAIHEAGHALLSLMLIGVKPPARVSIVSRADPFGKSPWSVEEGKDTLTKRELMAQLMVLLGGRAAELNTFGDPSTRAEDDLKEAARLARRMVESWGMTGRFELAGHDAERISISSGVGAGDDEVRGLLQQAQRGARSVLADNVGRLDAIAEILKERETLTDLDLIEITGLASWRRSHTDDADQGSSPTKAPLQAGAG